MLLAAEDISALVTALKGIAASSPFAGLLLFGIYKLWGKGEEREKHLAEVQAAHRKEIADLHTYYQAKIEGLNAAAQAREDKCEEEKAKLYEDHAQMLRDLAGALRKKD